MRAKSRILTKLIPSILRHKLFRRGLNLSIPLSADVEIKIAETQDEFHQAFRILHDSYVDAGFMDPDPSGLRVTPYHVLPGTVTYIAVTNKKVVATMSVIRDNSFGLPMQDIFDLSELRSQGQRLAEVSALAIDRNHRVQKGALLFSLIRFMWLHSYHRLGIDRFVITVNPSMSEFYEAFLLFKKLNQKSFVKKYDFVKGAPGVGQYIDLKSSAQNFLDTYGNRSPEKNLHTYFFASSLHKNYCEQRRHSFLTDQHQMTASMKEFFLKKRTSLWQSLSLGKKLKMASAFQLTDPEEIFLPTPAEARFSRSPRWESECPLLQINKMCSIGSKGLGVAMDVSLNGLKIRLDDDNWRISLSTVCELQVLLSPGTITTIKAIPVWKKGGTLGLRVIEACSTWNTFFAPAVSQKIAA